MFEGAKVGDRVWSFQNGWGTICDIVDSIKYSLIIKHDNGNKNAYTLKGKAYKEDQNPTLLWNEVKYDIPSKPMPDLPVDTKVIVWCDGGNKCKRHFSHFEEGKMHCFLDGATSWSEKETASWSNWELAE